MVRWPSSTCAPGPGGQIDVDAAAEADQADALARLDAVAFLDERQDPPRDQAGDLGEADRHPVVALDQEMLPLIVLARLVEVGVEELARDIGDLGAPCPAIGERLMWTSNTLMKIDTRVNSPARPPSPASSSGGGTRLIIVTSPSAGATISLGSAGVVRTGSRKKAATQIVRPTSSQPRKWLSSV